jgi:hypothetical protein
VDFQFNLIMSIPKSKARCCQQRPPVFSQLVSQSNS